MSTYLQPIDEVQRTEILGCPVDALSLAETVDRARSSLIGADGSIQVSINALKVGLADEDPGFREALGNFDIASADGQPIVWASRLLRRRLPGRVNGTDLMFELLEVAEREGFSVYVLGAREAVLEDAVAELRRRYPALRLAGHRNGYFESGEQSRIVAEIAGSGADLLFVALPSPQKEWFLVEHAAELGVGFAMGVGGSIDVLAGAYPRAPVWMQRTGLEWLFRLLQDPARMWRRYLATNTRFLVLLGKALLRRPGTRLR
jgi:N-acetylglucosaminyldiphosphoundecaprenol N-acetyl-beta-D-mannosaminyltransferase